MPLDPLELRAVAARVEHKVLDPTQGVALYLSGL